MKLKIGSYNIRKAVGLDRRRRPERILSVLNRMDADVVLLQEADRRFGSRPTAIPRALIERETPYHVADLARTHVSLGWHGNAILVRRGIPVESTAHFDLPGLEPRGAVMARIGGLHVVGTHLALLRRWRKQQMRAILLHLGDRADTAIVGGDFNEWSSRSGFEPWQHDLHLVTPGATFHSSRPIAPLDRFAHGRFVRMSGATVITESTALRASDHLPIVAHAEFGR